MPPSPIPDKLQPPPPFPPAQLAARLPPRAPALPGGRGRLLLFLGPAALVSVGYMDPGNWATDLEGGARFGYQLLWVLVVSNLMALMLQTLAARLGVVTGMDLAQACRAAYPKSIVRALWLLAELAIVACDLAEVIGSALALNMLFGLPLLWGAILTVFDVLLIFALQRRGMRPLETIIIALVLTVAACLFYEIWLVKPWHTAALADLAPRLDNQNLYIAIGILGATVMPHNLYLHSSIVSSRRIGPSVAEKRQALRYYFIDTGIALNFALLVNAAILVLAAAAFWGRGIVFDDIRQAQQLLAPLLGTSTAATAFALALLCAGQSSTITGTLAGQIVMEGFLQLRIAPVLRRALTRLLALVPALLVLSIFGERGTLPLLIASQVVLSLQLPFAVIPLVRFTNSEALMGGFANPRWIKILAAVVVTLIVAANALLVARTIDEWAAQTAWGTSLAVGLALVSLTGLAGVGLISMKNQSARISFAG
ncbi:MAG: manganese transport protein [Rhodocyclales bacterium]|nr:manganese transport protein [Rhodocyclales bacterium]